MIIQFIIQGNKNSFNFTGVEFIDASCRKEKPSV